MEKLIKNKKIICYGDIVWDKLYKLYKLYKRDKLYKLYKLSSALRPAGAPLNVAYHFKKMGVQSYIISYVGNDILGEELLKIIKKWCVDGIFCIVNNVNNKNNNLPTGKIIVDALFQEVSYEIMEPVAWDFIAVEKELSKMIKNTDGFVFQSMTARNEKSRKTLHSLLEYSCYKIFDVNLRPPFYSEQIIKILIEKSDIVKMSVSELYEIVSWFHSGKFSEEEAVCFLKECFHLKELLITKGCYGASYYGIAKLYERRGITIKVKDTIGSGDAFLSGFLAKKINGNSSEEAIEQAITISAFVASKEESCTFYEKTPK